MLSDFVFPSSTITKQELDLSCFLLCCLKLFNIRKRIEQHSLNLKCIYIIAKNRAAVCKCDDYVIIAFRGTTNPSDLYLDFSYQTIPFEHGGVHKGFYDLAVSINMDRLSALIDDKTKILVCGHSMGGSAAIILYYLLAERFSSNECKVITFGAPLCFTREVLGHSVKMNNIINIIHEEDTIPFVTSPDHYLSQLNRITSTIYSFCSHFIDKTRLDSTLSKYTTDIKSFITSQLYFYPVGTFYVITQSKSITMYDPDGILDYYHKKDHDFFPNLFKHVIFRYASLMRALKSQNWSQTTVFQINS